MWCWRRIEKIIWTDRVKNEEGLHTANEGGKEYCIKIKGWNAVCIGYIFLRNCLLEHFIEGKIEG
jgi:hypothetical protein